MNRLARAAISIACGAGLFAVVAAIQPAGAGNAPLGPGKVRVDVDVEHSRFSIDHLRVAEGTTIEFVVHNHDPINHELIVGTDEVQKRHEKGTDLTHPPIPGEVSVGPDDDGLTAIRLDDAGTIEFACHLPGHYAYGMHGTIEVVASRG